MDTATLTTPDTVYTSKGVYQRTEAGTYTWTCGKCDGSGYISHYSFNAGGICFQCNGVGKREHVSEQTVRNTWKAQLAREAAREAKRLKIVAERDRRVERMTAQYPDVMAVLQDVYNTYNGGEGTRVNTFLLGLAEQVLNAKGKDLTEAQVQAVRNGIAREAERAAVDAKRPDVPEGKLTITGTVVSTKVQHGDYGTTYKMLVEAEQGFKVFGTIPSSMLEQYTLEELKATKVTFTATVERSRDDRSFGFFKRPTKGVVHS